MVAGVWHYINVSLEKEDFKVLTIKLYNQNNFYEWWFDGSWNSKELEGREYIKKELCYTKDNLYSFCVGIKDTLPSLLYYYQNWTLELYLDDLLFHSQSIVVEKPTPALAKSHADVIQFNVDPFTPMNASGNDFFIIENTGNIPLQISLDYGSYSGIIDFMDKVLSPYTSSTYYLTLHSESWKPGTIEVSGYVNGLVPRSIIVPSSNYTFETSIKLNAPELRIHVGHKDYEMFSKNDVTFQYLKNLEMREDEIKDVTAYLSGKGTVALDLRSENITILKVFCGNTEVAGLPLVINLKEEYESEVKIRIKALKENSPSFLFYDLLMGREKKVFVTKISVGPPFSTPDKISINITSIAAILWISVFVVCYMVHSRIKCRRR
jgi:hypothetical protein